MSLLILIVSVTRFYSFNTHQISHQIPKEYLTLEKEYEEQLQLIQEYKTSAANLYWFIVSWLKTNYGTPNFKNYKTENWRIETKKSGIDCSGFARVMQKEIYQKDIKGSSQQIMDNYCKKINLKNVKEGDLLFFKNPYSTTNKITHVGIYLFDDVFVHATSKKSAAKGEGLRLDSIKSTYWTNALIHVGRIMS